MATVAWPDGQPYHTIEKSAFCPKTDFSIVRRSPGISPVWIVSIYQVIDFCAAIF